MVIKYRIYALTVEGKCPFVVGAVDIESARESSHAIARAEWVKRVYIEDSKGKIVEEHYVMFRNNWLPKYNDVTKEESLRSLLPGANV